MPVTSDRPDPFHRSAMRATRSWRTQPVPRELVERIVAQARWTGSARNAQPWRFVHVTDETVRRRLSALGAYARPATAAPHVLVLLHHEPSSRRDTPFDLGRITQTVCLLAAREGLGTCPVTFFPDDNGRAAAVLVGADEGWRADHAIALGYPAPPTPLGGTRAIPSGRLPVDRILSHHEPEGRP